jgi:hypothetical protein
MTNKAVSTKMVQMKRLFPLAVMGLGLLLIIATTGFWIFSQKDQHPSSAPLPEMVADLPLTQSLAAEKAIDEFTRLHGNDFPLVSGAVGMYGPDHSITLWVAGASTISMAGRMVNAMRGKITSASGKSPFSPVGERQEDTRSVYELEGIGQKHFYFQSGKMIVWLAANPERAEEALTEVLKFYP